jgi:hypothetical protein
VLKRHILYGSEDILLGHKPFETQYTVQRRLHVYMISNGALVLSELNVDPYTSAKQDELLWMTTKAVIEDGVCLAHCA